MTSAGVARSMVRALATRPYLVLVLVLLVTFAAYAPAMNHWFQYDDFLFLRGTKEAAFFTYVREAFTIGSFELLPYRPLAYVTTRVLYDIFELDATPYHLFQIAFHLINVSLVWWITRTLTRSSLVAHVAALVFGVHPIYIGTVAWVAAINSLLATTGQLVSFSAFILFVRRDSRSWLAASIVAYAIAMFFHQEVFLLPGVLGVYFWVERRGDILRSPLRAAYILAPFGVILAGFIGLQSVSTSEGPYSGYFSPNTAIVKQHVGALGMSAFPALLSGLQWLHIGAAVLGVLAVVLTLVVNPQRRHVILIAVLWYHASLFLAELYWANSLYDVVPYMARKLYPAGPALAIMIACVGEALWTIGRQRLPVLTAVAAPVLFVLLVVLAVGQTSKLLRDHGRPAERSQAFVEGLRAEHPTIAEHETLYVANVPDDLLLFCTPGKQCLLEDAVYLYYGNVQVKRIAQDRLMSPEFLAGLGPDEKAFCWRCTSQHPERGRLP